VLITLPHFCVNRALPITKQRRHDAGSPLRGVVDGVSWRGAEEQRGLARSAHSCAVNEMMVKSGTHNKASMTGKGKALILGRLTDGLWVEVQR
jgi:hypothetical protein